LPDDIPPSLARAALAAEPAFRRAKGHVDAGAAGACEPLMAPWRLFLPSFDLPLAAAVARLVGARAIPEPPFCGPIGVGPWSNA
jgi:tRNA(Ile)-lysidine synthase